MEKGGFDNIANVVVCKAVDNVFALLTVGYKVCLAQGLYLVGNGGAGHSQKVGNVANAHWTLIDGEKDAHSCGIAENFEKVRKVVEGFCVGHFPARDLYKLVMYFLTFAGGNACFALCHFGSFLC